MAFNKTQFQSLIERVLKEIDLYSEAAVQLLLGTAAVESGFGKYLRQLGKGPALSVFMVEPATFNDLKRMYTKWLTGRQAEELEYDLRLAIIAARLKYLSIPRPLPAAGDIAGLAAYWKRWYNTPLGAGSEEDFRQAYSKYVGA